MTTIRLTTSIDAPIDRCFDIARDIDVHQLSMEQTNEKAIGGRITGLAELDDVITWEARHFGITQQLTVTITKFQRPDLFEDTMLKGAFKTMRHEHHFKFENGVTIMSDRFQYEVPFGLFGATFNYLVLERYMTNLLLKRNAVIKKTAEQP